MAKEAQLPAQVLGPNKISIGRFEVPIELLGSFKSLELTKIRFKLSAMALINLATLEGAVGATALAVEALVEFE